MAARATAAGPSGVVIPDDGDEDVDPALAVHPDTTDAEAAANAQKLGPRAKKAPVGMPKTVRIILEETENMAPTGQMFSLNGRAYLIRPGEPVDIPIGILEVIDNAVMSVPIIDQVSMKVVGHRNRHRFPYRLVGSKAA